MEILMAIWRKSTIFAKDFVCLCLFRFSFGIALCHCSGPMGDWPSGWETTECVLASAPSLFVFIPYNGRIGRRSEAICASQFILVQGNSFLNPSALWHWLVYHLENILATLGFILFEESRNHSFNQIYLTVLKCFVKKMWKENVHFCPPTSNPLLFRLRSFSQAVYRKNAVLVTLHPHCIIYY